MTMKTAAIKKRLGWKPDIPDFRDYRWSQRPEAQKPAAQANVSLREQCSPVRDQGALGSCVGFSSTACVEYLRRTDTDIYSTIYSPLFVYYECRRLEGSIKSDDGAYIRDAIKVLVNVGAAPESIWPYKPSRFATTPSKTAYKAASRWKLAASYYRCDTLDDVLSAIEHGHPVVGGLAVFDSFGGVDETGEVPMPHRDDAFLGGHALMFMGFSRESKRVWFKNSWGKGWGDRGFGSVLFDYIASRDLCDDCWVLVAEA